MNVLGLQGCDGTDSHDASAALLRDGVVVCAVEEERFCRRKHAPGRSPVESALFCLKEAGICLSDIDAIGVGWNEDNRLLSRVPAGKRDEWASRVLPKDRFGEVEIPEVFFVKHHLSHIAGAFYLSGFSRAACICVDGQGETEAITIAKASMGNIEILCTFDRCFSLGALYEAASFFCGLGYDVPGKLMGLASYGKAMHQLPLSFNEETGQFSSLLEEVKEAKANASDVCSAYVKHFESHIFPFCRGCPEQLMSYINVAASVQDLVGMVLLGLARYTARITGEAKLVLCGGVALNCTCNGLIERSKVFERVFVPPGANDAGCSIGAAMEVLRLHGAFDSTVPPPLESARLGPAFVDSEVLEAFKRGGLNPVYCEETALCNLVAEELSKGAIILWFQGRAEFGPRALGGRSVLASPSPWLNSLRVNSLKRRELWRPLAPSIVEGAFGSYLADNESALS
jgi:carbamoyltransferase